jgi:hypothetical protein
MSTAFIASIKPTKVHVLIVALFFATLFGCYGLLSAQQARSATTLSKQVWGGIRYNGTIAHQKHITSVTHPTTGFYNVTFDRHVDNCSIQVGSRYEGGAANIGQFDVFPGSNSNEVQVEQATANASSLIDGDFDIFAMCPSS